MSSLIDQTRLPGTVLRGPRIWTRTLAAGPLADAATRRGLTPSHVANMAGLEIEHQ